MTETTTILEMGSSGRCARLHFTVPRDGKMIAILDGQSVAEARFRGGAWIAEFSRLFWVAHKQAVVSMIAIAPPERWLGTDVASAQHTLTEDIRRQISGLVNGETK